MLTQASAKPLDAEFASPRLTSAIESGRKTMKKILLAAVTLGAMSSAAFAEPVKLTDTQLDGVTAGQALSVSVSTASNAMASAASSSSASVTLEFTDPAP